MCWWIWDRWVSGGEERQRREAKERKVWGPATKGEGVGAGGRGGRETHGGEGEGELGAEGGVGVEQGEVLFEEDVDFGGELLGGHGCGGHCGREVVVVVIGSVAYGGRGGRGCGCGCG